MDNWSEENDFAMEEIVPSPYRAEGEDIEFDEAIDLDAIQKKLQAHMGEIDKDEIDDSNEDEDADNIKSASFDGPLGEMQQETTQILQSIQQEIDPKAKKYVIYIDPENVDHMEKLSLNDRKTIINKILRDYDASVIKQKYEDQRKKYIRHAIVATLTFIIGFPILFMIANNSMEATIDNYKIAQKNFTNLYRENGKIQQKPSATERFKY